MAQRKGFIIGAAMVGTVLAAYSLMGCSSGKIQPLTPAQQGAIAQSLICLGNQMAPLSAACVKDHSKDSADLGLCMATAQATANAACAAQMGEIFIPQAAMVAPAPAPAASPVAVAK